MFALFALWKPILLVVGLLGFGVKMGFDHWQKSRLENSVASLKADNANLAARGERYAKEAVALQALVAEKDARMERQDRILAEKDAAIKAYRDGGADRDRKFALIEKELAEVRTDGVDEECPLGDGAAIAAAFRIIGEYRRGDGDLADIPSGSGADAVPNETALALDMIRTHREGGYNGEFLGSGGLGVADAGGGMRFGPDSAPGFGGDRTGSGHPGHPGGVEEAHSVPGPGRV